MHKTKNYLFSPFTCVFKNGFINHTILYFREPPNHRPNLSDYIRVTLQYGKALVQPEVKTYD
jgi:hypothetical protein